jgi:hypothetical protein
MPDLLHFMVNIYEENIYLLNTCIPMIKILFSLPWHICFLTPEPQRAGLKQNPF